MKCAAESAGMLVAPGRGCQADDSRLVEISMVQVRMRLRYRAGAAPEAV